MLTLPYAMAHRAERLLSPTFVPAPPARHGTWSAASTPGRSAGPLALPRPAAVGPRPPRPQATRSTLASTLRKLVGPDVALTCLEVLERETRKKDDEARKKDDDLRRKDQAVEKLTSELRVVEREHERVKASFLATRTDLLAERGLLHMRGVIEYIEGHETGRLGLDPYLEREQKWAHILAGHPALTACLLRANPTKRKPKAPAHERAATLVPNLYEVLSLHVHPVLSLDSLRARGPVTIATKRCDPRLADMVACMCEHYYIDFDRLSDAGDVVAEFRSARAGLPRRTGRRTSSAKRAT